MIANRSHAALCVAVLLAACSGGGEDPPPPPPAPTIAERAPAPDAVDATEAYVMVKFSEPMDAASLAGGISVSRVGGGAVDGAVSASGDLAYFIPSAPLPAAATLEVTVSADVRSAVGGRLGAPITWTFTTAHWREVSAIGAPTARSGHTAVWTGSEVIVWGGTPATMSGGRYDPATDSWAATAVSGAPAARTGHSAVWTGSEMIVWGGTVNGSAVATGGRYDPAANTWRSMSTVNAPSARSGHTAVWTGDELIVWGGTPDFSGGRYDPATDTWTPTSLTNAPMIQAEHRALWTGARMLVWGGIDPPPPSDGAGIYNPCPHVVARGGLYDPATDAWTPTSADGAPTPRKGHAMVWTGSQAALWGGCASAPGPSGLLYDPAADAWTAMADAGAPYVRSSPHAAWTGSRVLVWGGFTTGLLGTNATDGALFDPSADAWAEISSVGAGSALPLGAASAWTGSELVVWGGQGGAVGARFTP